jgi:ATP-binding cassette subfamily B protein
VVTTRSILGVMSVVEGSSTGQAPRSDLLRSLIGYVRPYRRLVTLVVVGLLVDTAFYAVVPYSFTWLVDEAIVPRNGRALAWILGALAVAVILASVTAVARDYGYARLSAGVQNDIRLRMFEHLNRLSMDFYARSRVGDLMAHFSTDLAAVEGALVSALPAVFISGLSVLVSSALLFSLDWRLATVTVVGLPLCLVGPRILAPRAAVLSYEVRQQEARIASTVQETISAQAVVKAFGLRARIEAAFRAQLQELFTRNVRLQFLGGLVARTPGVSVSLLQIFVMAYGGYLCFRGTLSLGSFVAFNALFQNVHASISDLTQSLPALLQASGGARRIDELLSESPRIEDAAEARPLPRLRREITFDHVSFSYTGETLSLIDATLSIPGGATVAFVGPSGSGKSTVLNLLVRFHDPTRGTVAFDGHDLRQITQDSLRGQIAIVFQESFLFNTSIRENIRVGRAGATDAEVEDAARAAGVHSVVAALPQGYDSTVGERGDRLSGGQRQRIAIARALLRDPAVLVLDEATSALDPATEAAINDTLAGLAGALTVVAVTHRLQTVVAADRIFVMEAGRIVEEGTHPSLLARQSVYRRLWDKQAGVMLASDGTHAEVSVTRLKAVPILTELDEALLRDLAALFVTERYGEGRVVIQEGDPADKFYVIAHGRVDVTRRDPYALPQRLADLEDGDHFGEVALLWDVPRTATVRTSTPCVFLTLGRSQFLRFVQRDPGLQTRLIELARERMTESDAAGLSQPARSGRA